MSYIQLPFGKIEKDNKTIKLTNFSRNHNVSVLSLEVHYVDNINDTEFQCCIIGFPAVPFSFWQTRAEYTG